jgi:hypothetical protein
MKVRYIPSHANGTYDMDVTEEQWQSLKNNSDFQLLSAADIAAEAAKANPPQNAPAAQAIAAAIDTLKAAEAEVQPQSPPA